MNEDIQRKEKNIHGIDVSHWNGIVDWKYVAKSGIRFAMLKCMNKSNQIEINFENNYQECLKNNIYVGVYIYVMATTKEKAKAAIEALLGIIKNRKIRYGVWLDVEDKVLADLKEFPELIEFMLDKLHKAGYTAGVYCNLSWYNEYFKGKQYLFWIARYPVEDNGEVHPALDPEIGVCWQYSSKGKVPGIVGNVDMDLAKVDISKIKEKEKSLVERILEILGKIISRFLM